MTVKQALLTYIAFHSPYLSLDSRFKGIKLELFIKKSYYDIDIKINVKNSTKTSCGNPFTT